MDTGLRSWPARASAAAVWALALSSCGPVRDGPQLREEPPGLTYSTAWDSARHPLLHRPKLRQITYGQEPTPAGTQHVTVTVYASRVPLAEAQEARDEYESRYGRSEEYGPAFHLRVDGRPALGWLVTERGEGAIRSRTLVAVVPHDGLTYGLEYMTSGVELRTEPELLAVVTSFYVADSRRTSGKVYLATGLLLAGLTVALGARHLRRRPSPAG